MIVTVKGVAILNGEIISTVVSFEKVSLVEVTPEVIEQVLIISGVDAVHIVVESSQDHEIDNDF